MKMIDIDDPIDYEELFNPKDIVVPINEIMRRPSHAPLTIITPQAPEMVALQPQVVVDPVELAAGLVEPLVELADLAEAMAAVDPVVMNEPQQKSPDAPGRAVAKKKKPKKTSKPRQRGPWQLPEGWRVIKKPRMKGKTKGVKDTYYIDPVKKRKFRSRNEVEYYLLTGKRLRSQKKKR